MTGKLRRVAIVGAATLKGRELKEVLEERKFPAVDVKLLDDDESLGQLEAVGEEATFIQSVLPENFQDLDFVFFASEAEFTRRHWQDAQKSGGTIVDLSYALEQEPGSSVRSPWIERELALAGTLSGNDRSRLQVATHPAATVLGLLLLRATRVSPARTIVANIFEPASEQGRRGMDELHQQTVNLLSFQQMPKSVFDSQVAFNLLSRYGAESTRSLEAIERRILAHFAEITGASAQSAAIGTPSVMLLQGPIFHSHAFSIYVELEKEQSIGDFSQSLAGDHVSVARLAEDAPTNVSAAGQSEIQVAVRRDAQRENAFWIWAAADNLKIAALTAVECAETSAPQQPIQ